jgi:hypothetical protein
MIPSWRKRKAEERKARHYYGGTIYPNPYTIAATYCPNCGHRFDRTGHRFACH